MKAKKYFPLSNPKYTTILTIPLLKTSIYGRKKCLVSLTSIIQIYYPSVRDGVTVPSIATFVSVLH